VSRLRENFTSGSDGEGLETDHKKRYRASPLPDNHFSNGGKNI
jgi:hypothetical protein